MQNRRQIVLGILLLGLACAAAYFGLKWIFSQLSGASDSIKAASIAAIVSVSTFLVGRYFEQRRELTSSINKEKIRVYQSFFDLFFELFSGAKVNDDKPEHDTETIARSLAHFHKELMFWGSDEVIEKYYVFKRSLSSGSDFSSADEQSEYLANTLSKSAELFASMRRDIGYSFTRFNAAHLSEFILDQSDPQVHELMKRFRK